MKRADPRRAIVAVAAAWLAVAAIPRAVEPPSIESDVLRDATVVLQHAMLPPAAIPSSVIAQARAIAVVPMARRDDALYYGMGALSGRSSLDGWTPPAIVAFQAQLPIEIETNEVDFVVLALTPRGVDYLTERQYAALLSDPIAAGPLTAPAARRADLVAYVRFALMFAGITLENWEMRDAKDANERLYGRAYSSDDILRGAGFFHLPQAARIWRNALISATRERS